MAYKGQIADGIGYVKGKIKYCENCRCHVHPPCVVCRLAKRPQHLTSSKKRKSV